MPTKPDLTNPETREDIYQSYIKPALNGEPCPEDTLEVLKHIADGAFKKEAKAENSNIGALMFAAVNTGQLEAVLATIIAGADIHEGNNQALRFAAQNGHTEMVDLLLEHGANIHAKDDEALRCAADTGHVETVALLLERGADIHVNNDEALLLADNNGHTETVALIKNYDAIEAHCTDDDRRRVMYSAAALAAQVGLEIEPFLVQQ